MSVMMGMRMQVDPERFMQVSRENAEQMKAISERGRQMGAIRHAFFAGDGEVLVVDEWESPEAFQAFFEQAGEEIGGLMAQAGVDGPPQPQFWRELDTADKF